MEAWIVLWGANGVIISKKNIIAIKSVGWKRYTNQKQLTEGAITDKLNNKPIGERENINGIAEAWAGYIMEAEVGSPRVK